MPLFFGEDKISQVVISVENADGGINTNDATLTSGGQMLSGVTAYSKGTKYTGTIATVEGPTPDISVSGSGLITASVSNPKGYQSSATTKTATQQLTTQGAKVITPSDSAQTAINSGVYATGSITVSPVPTETKTITANGTYSPSAGKYFSSVEVAIAGDTPTYQSKTVSPSTSVQTVTADSGYDALSDVTVNAIQTETKSVTANGTYNPTSGKYFSSVTVNVPSETFSTQTKTVTPTESEQTIAPDTGYDGLSSVTVGAISSTYVGSAIPTQDTITITPNMSAQTAVSAGTYVTGDVLVAEIPENYIDTSDATATADDMAKNKTAYVNGEKVTGNVTEIASGVFYILPKTSDISVSYAAVYDAHLIRAKVTSDRLLRESSYIQVQAPPSLFGDATAANVISGKTFTSSAGVKVSGTMPSKDAATIIPTTTDQTIDAGQYLSGAQTIQGDANLLPENIASGVSIFGVTGTHEGGSGIDTSDATATATDIVSGKTAYVNGAKLTGTLVVQNYYTGTTTPDSTTGDDGDLYFKVSR